MGDKTLIVEDKNWGFKGTVEEAIRDQLQSSVGNDGVMEDLRARVDSLENLVARYIASNIKNVDDLNALSGYERYKEVTND